MLGSPAIPPVRPRVFDEWFREPESVVPTPPPLVSAAVPAGLRWVPQYPPARDDRLAWLPFRATAGAFALALFGLAHSFRPHAMPQRPTIREVVDAPEGPFTVVATLFVFPITLTDTMLAQTVLRGEATVPRYD